jgi:transposase
MMTNTDLGVFAGIDTHAEFHHAALIDAAGRELADRRFPATRAGFAQLVGFFHTAGTVVRVAVEGTGSYGAAVTRVLLEHGFDVAETTPGDKADRRLRGKTDAADAYTAARAALSGRARAIPKATTGEVEALRLLRTTRSLTVRQQTQVMNQIKQFLVTAPAEFRERFPRSTNLRLVRALTATRLTGTDPVTAALLTTLRIDARRWLELRATAAELTKQLNRLTEQVAPALTAVAGVGPDTAAALLVATGQNTQRVPSDGALAHLFGIAPIPASSGRTNRHRLDRGGNRQANAAVHRVALVRLAHDPATRDYIARCMARGKTKREGIRLLKRHLVRELYPLLAAIDK